MIYLGADHRGYTLKEDLKARLDLVGTAYQDLGNLELDPGDDYVDFAKKVAEEVEEHPQNFGIVLCGSGVGVDIVANKFDGIRCALIDTVDMAVSARNDDDANMLALSGDNMTTEVAFQIVEAFITTPFAAEDRFNRRLEKIKEIEKTN